MQSHEPVCHILIRLHLIQDEKKKKKTKKEKKLLEMKTGPWLAKLYPPHARPRQVHFGRWFR